MNSQLDKEMINNMITFMGAVIALKLERGENKVFTCPICQGEAIAGRAESNGHYHAYCTKCKENFRE